MRMCTTKGVGCFLVLTSIYVCAPVQARNTVAFDATFDVCRTTVSDAESRNLTRELLETQRRLKSAGDDTPASRELKARMLTISERLECKRLQDLSSPVERGNDPTAIPQYIAVRVPYATDRLADAAQRSQGAKDPNTYFTGNLDRNFSDFSFGAVTVTIPVKRSPGDLPLPSWWQITGQSDPTRYFTLKDITELDRRQFIQELNTADAQSSLLIFVHGFNVTFADGAMRTAQLAYDLHWPGKAMLYSWPSVGRVADYWKDEESSEISTARFRQLLKDLLHTDVKHIYIVAHSMGTRIAINTISELGAQHEDLSKVRALVLAAADFNSIRFEQVAAALVQLNHIGTHTLIYAASNDFALRASRIVHQYSRVGESIPQMGIYPDLISVDASTAAPMRREYGHSYVCDSLAVVNDMADALLKELTPGERGLEPISNSSGYGWKIPQLQ
jgi:esterase/lipase superfamily enzyme